MAQAIADRLATEEVAKILRVTPGRIRQFHVEGRLVGRKIGSMLWFERADVEAFAELERPEGRPRQGAIS